MLIEFTVGNYLSFKDRVTLSMITGNIKEYEADNTVQTERHRLLKSAALYGANASGKSNVIKAMAFMKNFVCNSTDNSFNFLGKPFLLNTQNLHEPSHFEILFEIDTVLYRYGFELDIINKLVKAEWLFQTQNNRETNLFLRENENIERKKTFKEGKNIEANTRIDSLFLTTLAQFNGNIAVNMLHWFQTIKIAGLPLFWGKTQLNDKLQTADILLDEGNSNNTIFIKQMLKTADLGLVDLSVSKEEETDNEFLKFMTLLKRLPSYFSDTGILKDPSIDVNLFYNVYDSNGNIVNKIPLEIEEFASEGTKRFFKYLGYVAEMLNRGGVLFIDEMESRLHPNLTKAIIKLFNSAETNPKAAQLIFTTHDTNLLSAGILRRDQIWFTEKNQWGATDLYSLLEFKIENKKVRNDASFEKDYIQGRYGAIPYLGDFSNLTFDISNENRT